MFPILLNIYIFFQYILFHKKVKDDKKIHSNYFLHVHLFSGSQDFYKPPASFQDSIHLRMRTTHHLHFDWMMGMMVKFLDNHFVRFLELLIY